MRVLLVQGPLISEQMAHWDAVSELGVDLHIACAPGAAQPPVSARQYHFFQPVGWLGRGRLWWWYPGLGRLVRRLSPDVIHVTAETYGLFFSQLDLTRDRVVGHAVDNIWTHGSMVERNIRLWRAGRILPKLAGLASWNQAGLDLGYRYGLLPAVPTVIVPGRIASPQPFRLAASDRLTHRQGFGFGAAPVVGFLGRLVPEKGVDWLLQSYAKSSVAPSTDLCVYGDGPEAPALQRLASTLRVDAHFGGRLSRTEVPGFLAAIDVLVVPSLSAPHWAEQFGRVIVEAMFSGTPVIASCTGSIPEVVGEAAILVEEGDRPGLSAAIDQVISNMELRRSLGAAGLAWSLAQFSPSTLAQKLVSFWEEVVTLERVDDA